MKQLIEALTILLKYGNPDYPTHCEHDVMYICGIEPEQVSEEEHETNHSTLERTDLERRKAFRRTVRR